MRKRRQIHSEGVGWVSNDAGSRHRWCLSWSKWDDGGIIITPHYSESIFYRASVIADPTPYPKGLRKLESRLAQSKVGHMS